MHAPRTRCALFMSGGMHTYGTLMNDGGWCHKGEELLNKVLNKAHKKYSRCFVKLRLNHWCHMYYFNDVLTTFLGLGTFYFHCCLWRVRNILIWVLKMNDGLAQKRHAHSKRGDTCFLRFFLYIWHKGVIRSLSAAHHQLLNSNLHSLAGAEPETDAFLLRYAL